MCPAKVFLLLVLAHLAVDFGFLYPLKEQKLRRNLVKYALLAGGTAYLLLLQPQSLLLPLLLAAGYYAVKRIGLRLWKKGVREEVLLPAVQVLHLLVIAMLVQLPRGLNLLMNDYGWDLLVLGQGLARFYYRCDSISLRLDWCWYYLAIAFFLLTTVGGQVLGIFLKKYPVRESGGRKLLDAEPEETLPAGGRMIGYAERLLIVAFVLLGAYEAVGFLVAAKSILRFSESRKDKKMAEYVLVGTLLSYLLAVAVGVALRLLCPALVWALKQ